jgi:hypothetical protein
MIKKLQSPMQTHFYETLHLIYNNVRDSGAIGEEAFMQARIRFQEYIIDFLIQNQVQTSSIVANYERIRQDKYLKQKLISQYELSKRK